MGDGKVDFLVLVCFPRYDATLFNVWMERGVTYNSNNNSGMTRLI